MVADTAPKETTMTETPTKINGYAILLEVDEMNRVLSRFVCPDYEINTYEGLMGVVQLLWPGRHRSEAFYIMTPEAYVIHEKFWQGFYATQPTRTFHIRFYDRQSKSPTKIVVWGAGYPSV